MARAMTAYYNEIDPKAAAWLRELIKRNLIAPGEVDERSIIDVHPDDLRGFTQCHFFAGIGVWSYALRNAGWPDDRPVWSGSCPCQPFSAAGKGDEFADERHLWPAWFRLARELRPDAIFGEQVASKDALAWFDHVRTDLEGAGYAVGVLDTCAAGVGAPHIRQRLYFVAESDNPKRRANSARGHDSRGHDAGRAQSSGDVEGCGSVCELADATDADRRRGECGEEAGTGPNGERRRGSAGGSATGDVGNAQNRGLGIERHEEQQGSGGHADGAEQFGVSQGDAKLHGSSAERQFEEQKQERRLRQSQGPGATNGFWVDAVWIPCRDGKARPTEPGTFPLVTGAPARVVRLRGYGNSINAEQARLFIESYIEVRTA